MTTAEKLHQVEISPDDIDPAYRQHFELARRGVYYSTHVQTEPRTEGLGQIADAVNMREGWDDDPETYSIREAIYKLLTETREAAKLSGLRYRFMVDGDGNIHEIMQLQPVAEDRRATARARQMAKHVPWAPKMNDSSFVRHQGPYRKPKPKTTKRRVA